MATQRLWPDANSDAWAAGYKSIFNSANVPWTAQPMNVRLKAPQIPATFQSLTNYGQPRNYGSSNINNYLGPAANQGRGLSGNPGYAPVYVGGAGAGRGLSGNPGYTPVYVGGAGQGRGAPTPTTPPIPYSVDNAYKSISPTQLFSESMAPMNEPLSALPNTAYAPMANSHLFNNGDVLAAMGNMRYGRDELVDGKAPFFGSRTLGELPIGGGNLPDEKSWFGNLLDKGKKTWGENKWLVGDKENTGAIPLGLGLFNAFNQYTYGKESIKSMREQNALARESFALNKEGLKAQLEDQYRRRNSNDVYFSNPKLSHDENLAIAKARTAEDMKRFK